MSTTTPLGKIAIVVLTYRRVDEVGELLPILDRHRAHRDEDISILVIDNDPQASARQVVEEVGSPTVRYVHEPLPGIAHARNRALDETADAQLLIFIDDDERPLDTWLDAMLDTYRRSRPAGVTGPLYPDYAHEPSGFIVAGGFFVRKHYPEGHLMPAAGTGNLLLDLDQVRRAGLRFDPLFGLTGGSDHMFTRALIRSGGRIVWSNDAGLVDKVPAQRLTRKWVLQRQYRFGNTESRTSLALTDAGLQQLAARLRLTARGLVRVGVGGLRAGYGAASRSPVHGARGHRWLRRGLGMVAGAWGSTYVEYQRPVERIAP